MKKLSQRDPSWGDKKLGFSNTLIKNYGCTITALTMLADLFDVGDVNERLKAVNGFASGNLLIWSKINEALPWLKLYGVAILMTMTGSKGQFLKLVAVQLKLMERPLAELSIGFYTLAMGK